MNKELKRNTAERVGYCKHSGEGGKSKELISIGIFSKQRLERQKG
jgi:hypothetical protein